MTEVDPHNAEALYQHRAQLVGRLLDGPPPAPEHLRILALRAVLKCRAEVRRTGQATPDAASLGRARV
jgi:hypothetical protein